jgi:hypothetical protein
MRGDPYLQTYTDAHVRVTGTSQPSLVVAALPSGHIPGSEHYYY